MGTAQKSLFLYNFHDVSHQLQQLSGSGDDANESFTYDGMNLPCSIPLLQVLESLYFLDLIFVGDVLWIPYAFRWKESGKLTS